MKSELDAIKSQVARLRETTLAALDGLESELRRIAGISTDAEIRDDGAAETVLRLPIESGATSGGLRMHQIKIAIREDERFSLDRIANRASEACRARVTVNNLLRAAMIVIRWSERELEEEFRSGDFRRPHNHDAAGLDDFEQSIARLLVRVARDCQL
ncbi:MAG TPA: hypothetical protein P5081_06750 [Phycisphaerae bacterium]|nr:hypothetical protein [Phycisphaerae bacterium]HRW52570.1 hypothetical protein [Phycisphaerae bacterium]